MTDEEQRKLASVRILHRENTYVDALKKLINLLMPSNAGHSDVVKAQQIVNAHDSDLVRIELWAKENLWSIQDQEDQIKHCQTTIRETRKLVAEFGGPGKLLKEQVAALVADRDYWRSKVEVKIPK